MEENKTINSIDEYIIQFPIEVQEILQKIRNVIKESAPEAVEKISYQMPTFYLHGNLVHFAANKNHIGFYPAPSGLRLLNMNYPNIKVQKEPFSFLKTSRSHME